MHFDLLTLPFVGGYLFYSHFSLTAYGAVRAVGQHLLLRSAFTGFLLYLLARVLLIAAPYVAASGDLWFGRAMGTVPGLSLIAASGLITNAYFECDKSVVRMVKTPKAVLLAIAACGLVMVGVSASKLQPSLETWLDYLTGVLALVVGGCWVVCFYTEVDAPRALFRVSLFILIVVLVIAVSAGQYEKIVELWAKFSPVPDSAVPVLALLLGSFLWYPLNLIIPYETGLRRFHNTGRSDAMDRFLYEAAQNKSLIQLTLSDGKFYIGQIKSLAANPIAPNSFVRILPSISGYRKSETKELVLTSFYDSVFDELVKKEGFAESHLDKFIKVLPSASIFSANLFDPKMYIRFRQESDADARRQSAEQSNNQQKQNVEKPAVAEGEKREAEELEDDEPGDGEE